MQKIAYIGATKKLNGLLRGQRGTPKEMLIAVSDGDFIKHFGGFTLNWRDNERNMSDFGNAKAVEMLRAMGAVETATDGRLQNYDCRSYQATHIQGGTTMGTSPENSVLNPWLQHWDVSNLFVLGASSFPQNASGNPALTILAQTYRTTEAIVERYLQKPGPICG